VFDDKGDAFLGILWRVYGVWAEAAPAGYTLTPRPGARARPGPPRSLTILKVGVADFRAP
jgi:hypothetical protein